MKNKYIFKSKRLGFRTWKDSDLEAMAKINSSNEVMKYFPNTQTKEQTRQFIIKMNQSFEQNNYCYFAVDILKTQEFIGFIGLYKQMYESNFTPNVDIGWRLSTKFWNKGFATEGAKACINYATENLALEKIISITPAINIPSEKVMKKIGMQKVAIVNHPLLKNDKRLESCVLYEWNLAVHKIT